MARYGCVFNATNTQSTTVPIFGTLGSATCQHEIYEIRLGSDAAPADQGNTFLLMRHSTALAGGTAGTAAPLNAAYRAANATYMYGASIGAPTRGTSLFQFSCQQKQLFAWRAEEGFGFVGPNTANTGMSLYPTVTTSALNYSGTISFQE